METWLTLGSFDDDIVKSKLNELHNTLMAQEVKAHWPKSDPRSIHNTTRPGDYVLAGLDGRPALLVVRFLDKYDPKCELPKLGIIETWIFEMAYDMVGFGSQH